LLKLDEKRTSSFKESFMNMTSTVRGSQVFAVTLAIALGGCGDDTGGGSGGSGGRQRRRDDDERYAELLGER